MQGIQRGVSLYSFQEEFFLGTMNLDAQIAAAASFGALGIEVIPHQTFASYPDLSDREVEHWHELHALHGTTPVAYDSFADSRRITGRMLSSDELLDDLVRDMGLARRLGCEIVRVQMNTPLDVFEEAARHAEEFDQRLAIEVHAPMTYESRWIKRFIDVIDRVDNGRLGLMGDMSTFSPTFSPVIYDWARSIGASRRLLDYVKSAYEGPEPKSFHTLGAELGYLGATGVEASLGGLTGYMTSVDPETLVPHLPYLFHIQAKFWDMVGDDHEGSIDYSGVIEVLARHGWSGYLSSEYEGNRFIQDRMPVDSVDQLRRQHSMLKRLIEQHSKLASHV